MRNKSFPVQKNTAAQLTSQSQTFSISSAWQNLTDSQRSAWASWAEFQNLQAGQFVTRKLSGQSAFFQCNKYRLMLGQEILLDPIFTPYSLIQSDITVIQGPGTLHIRVDSFDDLDNVWFISRISYVLSAARNAKPARLKFCNTSAVGDNLRSIYAEYFALFGYHPQAGDRLWIEWMLMQADNYALSNVVAKVYTIQAEP
jgi:hypothetical protein